ncbi:MAG TPA: acyltransferase domain-containing protein, partial [Spirochaetota bacterium]|nr:acyltransferase domain-containing protein [Spirochaetota bacterium]
RYFIGHSLGECTALYCAGLLGFDETMRLVLKRSSLMKEASEKTAGEIMAVFKNGEECSGLIKASGAEDVYIANKNSENQTVISGNPGGISVLIDYLKKEKVLYKKLPLSGAFHTPLFSSASQGLKSYLTDLKFRDTDYTRIISNVTARPYPQDEEKVKELLVKQVVSPVEFIESAGYACSKGASTFIEAGPAGILTGLMKNINCGARFSKTAVEPKKGEQSSLDETRELICTWIKEDKEKIMTSDITGNSSIEKKNLTGESRSAEITPLSRDDAGFREYLENHRDEVERVLHDEYRKYKLLKELERRDNFEFYSGSVVISGVSIGLPGKSREMFSDDNFDCILKGENRIDLLETRDLDRQLDKNITRVNKKPDGNAVFQELKSADEVVQLAGQPGHFNKLDYGIEFENDKSDALAMAAGIEALRDAGIPLVPQSRKTSTGSFLFSGYTLPEEMQETTGVIRTSIFAGFDSIIDEIERYTFSRNVAGPYRLFEQLYYYIMETVKDDDIKRRLTDWFSALKKQGADEDYSFNRNLLLKMGFMGAPQFAQMIKAKGPNTQINSACASLTQGICMAEDWIRAGRCERVIVTGSEAVDPERLGQWLYSGFLAIGAATVEKNVSDAAKPFDTMRNGTIIGSGAAAVIVERADTVQGRGRTGQAEILGTVTGNSAFHGTRIDISHIENVMKKMITGAEKRHGIAKDEYTRSMVFMSHETFTPAVGGSAQAEINAIKGTFPAHYKNIVISNTKGYTGHTLGGGLEDPVMIKSLQAGVAPSIANLKSVPEEFSDLSFSKGEKRGYDYGLHFSAGFGSHFSMLFVRRLEETSAENPAHLEWLKKISGYERPELSLINKTLCIKSQETGAVKALTSKDEREKVIPVVNIQFREDKTAEAVSAAAGNKPAELPAAETGPEAVDATTIKAGIKDVIAEQTGYTTDMLEDELDLEAD